MMSYGFDKKNWGDLEEFQGNFINFGYWDDIDFNRLIITYKDRIKSSMNLYLHVLNMLDLQSEDQVLEIGCGRGMGMITLLNNFDIKSIFGLDFSPDQILRTRRNINKHLPGHLDTKLNIYEASAERTLLDNHSIDKIYSVEAIQHIKNFGLFGEELKRILKLNGQIILTAHLTTSLINYTKIREENLIIDGDELLPIQTLVDVLEKLNFNVRYYSIGEKVFHGFNKWLSQINAQKVSSYIYQAYLKKYIDYYVIIANSKPF